MKDRVSYGQLRRVLLDMGFRESRRESGISLKHASSGTVFLFRSYRSSDRIQPAKVFLVAQELHARDLLEFESFEDLLEHLGKSKISYLNTDLDLISSVSLTGLAAAFKTAGVFPLHVTHAKDGLWYATFETEQDDHQPEAAIAAMVAVAESLKKPLTAVWREASLREFNIGYDCGDEPWAFNQGLSNTLLERVAAVGASLRITLYPDRTIKTKPRKSSREKLRKR